MITRSGRSPLRRITLTALSKRHEHRVCYPVDGMARKRSSPKPLTGRVALVASPPIPACVVLSPSEIQPSVKVVETRPLSVE